MAMHLLVETAIVDSTEYEILSYEEVDELKKEYNFLANRIDASKRKLALESKVRDAALSLSRLYSKKGRQRRSLLGGVSDLTKHTDEELMASNRKCEELSQELWRLNNRAVEIQRRLLQHGAGILGMTHQGGIKNLPRLPPSPNSPSGTFSSVNRRGTLSSMNVEFDDRSFYRTPDKLDEFGSYDQSPPADKSSRFQRGDGRPPSSRRGSAPSDDPYTARRLEEANNQLRTVLIRLTSNQGLPSPGHVPVNGTLNGARLSDQLALLEQNVKVLQQSNFHPPPSPGKPKSAHDLERTEAILSTLWDMLVMGEEEIRSQRRTRGHDPIAEEYPESGDELDDEAGEFSISAFSAKVQALYTRATQLYTERSMLRQKVYQQRRHFETETEELKEQHHTRVDNLSDELSTLSSQLEQLANIVDQRESDIMTANGKVKNMMNELDATRAQVQEKREEARNAREELTAVMEQLDIQRRKDQQRIMEDNAGRGKDSMALEAEKQARAEAEEGFIAQIRDKEEELTVLQIQFDEVKEDRDITKVELDALTRENDERLQRLQGEIVALKEARRNVEDGKGQYLEKEGVMIKEMAEKEQQMARMDEEMRGLEGKVAELSTEVALLKAELDSAYGSRQQRAAETAQAQAAAAALEAAGKRPQVVDPGLLQELEALAMKNHELMVEIAQLKAEKTTSVADSNLEKRCKLLQNELDGMLADFENLTKQSIEFENERMKLEALVDGLRTKCENLETSLADERVRWLGIRAPNDGKLSGRHTGDIPGENTSTTVLKNEFKKMMRDMRAEQTKALRVCHDNPLFLFPTAGSLNRE
ncbi:Up-regulated during septation-domain-containing protein [Tuber borchii]|uniref:Up-regulated during septation-domain-containing protein n=1 Tax=Tuber borchii TaxID=42251 RepID=A0A2T6ZHX2_TUBBO|nr:Up-regulated during septation-domain-containing protein [Tuber borchii]